MSYVAIHDAFTHGEWRCPVEYYEAILHAWETQQRLVSFQTEDGADVTLRTSSIVAIVYCDDRAELAVKARIAREKMDGER